MVVTILFSGGIDSTSLIPYYKNLNYELKLLFINYGQVGFKEEWNSAQNIAKHYKFNLELIDVNIERRFKGEILGRNAFLISTALLYKSTSKGLIALGIHAGTNYDDCSPQFISTMQHLFEIQNVGEIKIDVPFLNWYKNEIYEYAKQNNVPLDLTYSCELGKEQPCNKCPSCKDLLKLHDLKK